MRTKLSSLRDHVASYDDRFGLCTRPGKSRCPIAFALAHGSWQGLEALEDRTLLSASLPVPTGGLALAIGPAAVSPILDDDAPAGAGQVVGAADEADVAIQLPSIDPSRYVPMPIPDSSQGNHSKSSSTGQSKVVSYNIASGQVTISDAAAPAAGASSGHIQGGPPAMAAPSETTGDVSAMAMSNLTLVDDPSAWPWCASVKLFMTFPSGEDFVASGTLIDPSHVLTAGHCVYDDAEGGWITGMTVVPGYEDGDQPYGSAIAIDAHSWSGWYDDEDFDHDIALVDLDHPIGALTGWRGYGSNDNLSFYTDNTFNIPGYPAEGPYDGRFMYTRSGSFDYFDGLEVGMWERSYGGQSGTGAYTYAGGDEGTVYAVLSNAFIDIFGTHWTDFPRITAGKYASIGSWIDEDTPDEVDLIPMYVRGSTANISAGALLSDMSYTVHNYSSVAWAGNVNVDVYLSTNDSITQFDTLIGSYSFFHDFDPKSSFVVDVPDVRIPAGTTTGDYYVGVILDISDAIVGNNTTSGWDIAPLHVDAAADLLGSYAVAERSTNFVWGDRVRVDSQIRNAGALAVTQDFSVSFVLSNDPIFTTQEDWYLGRYVVVDDVPGGSMGPETTLWLTLPTSAPAGFEGEGPFYIGMHTDALDEVSEGDEANNFGALGEDLDWVSFTMAPADLYGFTTLLAPDLTPPWGGTLPVGSQIGNNGSADVTEDFWVDFYLSNDQNFGDADDAWLDSYYHTDTVPATNSGPYTVRDLTLPDAPPPGYAGTGPFYIVTRTDSTDVVAEFDETNNRGSVGRWWDWDRFTMSTAEIEVRGNDGMAIIDGDAVPSPTDGTDFGFGIAGMGDWLERTFHVKNIGGLPLALSGLSVPSFATVIDPLVTTLAPSAADTLTIRVSSTAPGIFQGMVSFNSNDGDGGDGIENPFDFAIKGTFIPVGSAPIIGSLSDSPDPISKCQSLTLTADSVSGNGLTVARVEFYRDANGNGSLDSGDTFLGSDTGSSSGWKIAVPATTVATFALGANRYFAKAFSTTEKPSNVVMTTGTVNDLPVIGSLSDSPDPISWAGQPLTLTANSVAVPAGPISKVDFYRDSNGPAGTPDGVLGPSGSRFPDTLLGTDTSSSSGWEVTVPSSVVSSFPLGTNRYFAVATSTAGAASNAATTTGTVIDQTPPQITAILLNNSPGRSVSAIDPSGAGVWSIHVTFCERVNFTPNGVLARKVTFPGGSENSGDALTPASVSGSGTNTVTIAFNRVSVIDTWVKITLCSNGIADLATNALDGESRLTGSGRQYIFDPALDLPTGDGFQGGDAVFYVGSLRGDLSGDGTVREEDVNGFLVKFAAGDLDADFRGLGFSASQPDGQVAPADIDGFISAYNAAVAEGRHLDPLPNLGPQSEGGAEPLAIESAPTSVVVDGASAQTPELEAPLLVDAGEPTLSDYPTPSAPEADVLAIASQVSSIAPVPAPLNEAKPDEVKEIAVPQMSAGAVGSNLVPVVGLIETADVPLAFGAGDEVAPPSSEPALAPGSVIVDVLALPALAL